MTVAVNELGMAWSLLGQERFAEAKLRAAAILARTPDDISALVCHAMANWKSGGAIDDSISETRRAIALAPGEASIRHNLATLLASQGDFVHAAEEFRQALALKPDDTLAFYGLTQNSKFREESELVRDMVALYERGGLDAGRKEFLGFGLAKVFDDLGLAEQAMRYAIEANRLVKRPFDLAGETAALAELQRLADVDAFRKGGNSGYPSRAPLFIVGMNRSGTTLVESILSRHPEVLARGEMQQILNLEMEALSRSGQRPAGSGRHALALSLNPRWLAAQAERLVQQATARSGAPFKILTDKLPENAVRLGLIARLFPKARVVHVRRHPLDTGISNFFQRFSAGQGYSFRMDWIGARTRQIADAMALWKRTLDVPILDVSYEKLVTDPEMESRRIIAFAGIEWSDACLEPQRTQRSVLTASQWQVRQPIYRGSVDRWKQYEPWLAPMIEAMGGFEWIDREVESIAG